MLGNDRDHRALGRPDFEFSYHYPKELDAPFAILEHLPFNPQLEPPAPNSRDE